jgi:hypothetical protein
MTERTLRGRTAIVGIGETTYYRHGQSPDAEFKLALQAVVNACKDAGISPHDIDGFASYGNDRSEAGRLAVMRGRPLDAAKYDESRWIIEPFFHLYDCCQENDGAAAVIVVPAERARDFPNKPAMVMACGQGCDHRSAAPVHNMPNYPSSHFAQLAPRLYDMAKLRPADMGIVQCYENFTGGVLMSLVEHGLVRAAEANEILVPENLYAPDGRMPLNTSGGNLAECYMHGLELVIEAVRQIRGTAINQVKRNDAAIIIGGPMVTPVSSLILGSEAVL